MKRILKVYSDGQEEIVRLRSEYEISPVAKLGVIGCSVWALIWLATVWVFG